MRRIKRYPNRKLYDTEAREYVTLAQSRDALIKGFLGGRGFLGGQGRTHAENSDHRDNKND